MKLVMRGGFHAMYTRGLPVLFARTASAAVSGFPLAEKVTCMRTRTDGTGQLNLSSSRVEDVSTFG